MNRPQFSEESRGLPEPLLPASPPGADDRLHTAESVLPGDNTCVKSEGCVQEDSPAWRDEVAVRLSRYRARRTPRPPRYPSLRLRFDDPAPHSEPMSPANPGFEARTTEESLASRVVAGVASSPPANPPSSPASAKIIAFPRFTSAAPPAPLNELAEPVFDRPRILEAPDVSPPPPALGGITMEATQPKEVEKRPGIEIPLQSAPLSRRMAATAVDALVIAAASALFGVIFWKVAAVRPPLVQILELSAAVPCLFWAAYQYLLIVYSGNTPGLRLAGLELARFDGSPASRRLRRWRVLASYLSAVSLGMGYAWLFLDEDALCWHDRITRTYLAPKRP
jgi:uncharacterized RDD family membrane protein YckC